MLFQVTSSTGFGIKKLRMCATSLLKSQTPYEQDKDLFAFLDQSVSHCAEAPDGHLTSTSSFKYLNLLALNLKHTHASG